MSKAEGIYRPGTRPDLLDPGTLAHLGGIEFIARRVVEGFVMGLHRSPHRGFSAEFAELRAYQPGDDLRYLDWRMYGRSDRFFVKQFHEETNLRAYLLVDCSSSMDWSSAPDTLPTKFWYARHLAASLGLVLLRQGDAVGFAAFHDALQDLLPARGGERQWHELLRRLSLVPAGGGTTAHSALREVAVRLRRRGLVVLISDLLVDPEETRTALHFLRHRGHEVLVFHLLDPGEREIPTTGQVEFVDPESGEGLEVSVPEIRDRYREVVRDSLREWERDLGPHGIGYAVVDTGAPLSRALAAYMAKRRRLG